MRSDYPKSCVRCGRSILTFEAQMNGDALCHPPTREPNEDTCYMQHLRSPLHPTTHRLVLEFALLRLNELLSGQRAMTTDEVSKLRDVLKLSSEQMGA